jgi:hypothetical protein
MSATVCNGAPVVRVSTFPLLWRSPAQRSLFGDAAVIVFLIAQYLDGIFTYVGVASFGVAMEGNPLIVSLMTWLGHGPALVMAKTTAAVLGMALHLGRVHGAVALLAAFYMAAAVVPWTRILFSL